MIKVIKTHDFRRMPWKNGGGETIEIAVSPDNAHWGNFEWRVSMAHVTQSGPFSSFPDVDRSLAIVSGEGLRLSIGSQKAVTVEAHSAPVSFRGEEDTKGALIKEAVLDFNVMTHRDRFRHELTRQTLTGSESIKVSEGLLVLFVVSGQVSVEYEDTLTRVVRMEALMTDHTIQVTSVQHSELLLARLTPLAQS
jgi:environmental stress-induced protein Ves